MEYYFFVSILLFTKLLQVLNNRIFFKNIINTNRLIVKKMCTNIIHDNMDEISMFQNCICFLYFLYSICWAKLHGSFLLQIR